MQQFKSVFPERSKRMRHLSDRFTESLKAPDDEGIEDVRQAIRDVYAVSAPREGAVSSSAKTVNVAASSASVPA